MCRLLVVHLAAVSRNHPDVSRNPVSTLYFNQISGHHFFSVDLHLLTLPDHQGLLHRVTGVSGGASGTYRAFIASVYLFLRSVYDLNSGTGHKSSF